ncbi:hypothetical protein PHISCL_11127, partial [Aspergillus sclerotialis]
TLIEEEIQNLQVIRLVSGHCVVQELAAFDGSTALKEQLYNGQRRFPDGNREGRHIKDASCVWIGPAVEEPPAQVLVVECVSTNG